MKLFKNVNRKTVVTGLLISCGTILFYTFLINFEAIKRVFSTLMDYISPVVSGLLLAYFLRPFARFVERILPRFIKSERLRINISAIAALILVLVIISFLVSAILPQLASSITDFVNNFDSYLGTMATWIEDLAQKITVIEIDTRSLLGDSDKLLKEAGNLLKNNIENLLAAIYQLGSRLFNFVIVLAMSIYALIDRKNIQRGAVGLENVLLGKAKAKRLNEIIERGDKLMMTFLSSNLLDALIIGLVNFIFLGLIKSPYQLLLSLMLGITNFIPTFGPIIGGVIGSVVILLTKPSLVIAFIIFTFVLQQIDGNVIKPLLFGDSTGLSPFWVLVAIVVGGRVFGVLGMIIGVPLVALLASLCDEFLDRESKRQDSEEAENSEAKPDPSTD